MKTIWSSQEWKKPGINAGIHSTATEKLGCESASDGEPTVAFIKTHPSHGPAGETGFSALISQHSLISAIIFGMASPTLEMPEGSTSSPTLPKQRHFHQHIQSSRVKLCSVDNPPALVQYNILFQMAEFYFFFPFSLGFF